jgi:hypothetical protein
MSERLTKEQHLDAANDLAVEVGEWLAGNGDVPRAGKRRSVQPLDDQAERETAQIMVQLAQAHAALAALTPEQKGWLPA